MIMSNVEIASVFNQLADLLEIKGENTFKVRAYRNAARTIENLGTDLRKMLEEGEDISRIPTIGEHIAQKIAEIIKTGKLAKLEYLKHSFPPHLLDLLKVEGIGPKRAKVLYQELNIRELWKKSDLPRSPRHTLSVHPNFQRIWDLASRLPPEPTK